MSSAQDVLPVESSVKKSLRLILVPFLGAEHGHCEWDKGVFAKHTWSIKGRASVTG